MDVREMNLNQMIENGYLVKVAAITQDTGTYVSVTDENGNEELYLYIAKPDLMHVKVKSEPMY